jgi:trehalose synthase
MLGSVPITPKSLEDYRQVAGDGAVDEILRLASGLQGARVLHINATSFGGGVAELLNTLVPLMADVGLHADWQVIRGSDEFYNVTKAMHNSLQGMFIDWTPEMRDIWLHQNIANAELFDERYDFVIVHDPQPAGLRACLRERDAKLAEGAWAWRCHIDLTDAQVQIWDLLKPYIAEHDGVIVTAAEYIKDDLQGPKRFVAPPAIDPLSAKNAGIPDGTGDQILQRYGIDSRRPFITQISRFDPWKDPLGVIEVYRMVERTFPDLQLLLIASMAHDDPEGWAWYEKTVRRAGEDFDIHILSNLNGVGNLEVNAFQRSSRVVIQKSVREGFGLVVSEALWKERPVVAGRVGGIPLQLIDGETGYLVSTTEECADRVEDLIREPGLANQMGLTGTEFVRKHFLITRYLRDYLRIFRTLAGVDPVAEVVTKEQEVRSK